MNPLLGNETDVHNTIQMTLDVVERFYDNRCQGIYPTDYEIPEVLSVLIEECRWTRGKKSENVQLYSARAICSCHMSCDLTQTGFENNT